MQAQGRACTQTHTCTQTGAALLSPAQPPCLCVAGRTRITMARSGEVYTLVPPMARVHNIVIGRTWVDACGPLKLTCPSTGTQCVLEFTPCGWFSYGRHEFSGFVTDAGACIRAMTP